VPAPAVPGPATPAATSVTPAPAVPDVPSLVPFTPVADDGTLVPQLDKTADFSKLPEVSRVANALAQEYATRTVAAAAAKELAARQQAARKAATAVVPPEPETAAAKKRRIAQAVKDVPPLSPDELTALKNTIAADIVTRLSADWARHLAAGQAQKMKASKLANAWMRNRGQQLLFDTEKQDRPKNQERVWSSVWITPAAPGAPSIESDPSAGGVDPGTVPGGQSAGTKVKPLFIDPRVADFLTSLHGRFATVRFETYGHHGSVGFAGRGLSLDVYLQGTNPATKHAYGKENADNFWDRGEVLELLQAIDATAVEKDFHFYAIYNDFSVAKAANAQLVRGSVDFAGNVDRGGGLNYHGGGIKLHVHLDLLPSQLAATTRPR